MRTLRTSPAIPIFPMPLPEMTPEERKAYDTALMEIESCLLIGARFLDLSNLGLTYLPPEISLLTSSTGLSLDTNRLSVLPPEIGSQRGQD